MSRLSDRIYSYLIREENWAIAKEVIEKMELVRERLVSEFWAQVADRIERNQNKDKTEFEKTDSYIEVRDPRWNKIFSIRYDDIYRNSWIGVFYDQATGKLTAESFDQLFSELKAQNNKLRKQLWAWPGWFQTDNFEEWSTLDKILPGSRDSIVNEYVGTFITFQTMCSPIIQKYAM